MESKQEASIKDWSLQYSLTGWILTGFVVVHPKISSGEFVRTTPLESVDFVKKIAITKNTIYTLMEQL